MKCAQGFCASFRWPTVTSVSISLLRLENVVLAKDGPASPVDGDVVGFV